MTDRMPETRTPVVERPPETVSAPVTRREPNPFEEMQRLFESLMPRGWLPAMRWENPWLAELADLDLKVPRVDLIDRDNELRLKAELPGIAREDIEITVDANTVTLKGHSRKEEKEERGDYYRSEIRRGEFSRTLVLPHAVNASEARATFRDGLLEVTLPKLEAARRTTVSVQ